MRVFRNGGREATVVEDVEREVRAVCGADRGAGRPTRVDKGVRCANVMRAQTVRGARVRSADARIRAP